MKGKWITVVLSLVLAAGLFGAWPAAAAPVGSPSASTTIVISEFRTRGPNGGNDEFIEIFNLSSSAVNIGGWKINGSNNSGTTGTRVTISSGVSLGSGCRYLVTNSNASGGYSGSIAGDQTYGTGVTDDGGIAVLDASNVIIDQVGMDTGSAYKEGTTLTPLSGSADQSYERKPLGTNTTDTDNNANDFQHNSSSSNPQNSSSGCTPLAVTLAEFYAQQVADYVRVTWETNSELNNRGFNLYRGVSPAGWDTQLNSALIPSQSQGSPGGFVYTWDDYAGLVPGTTYYYWLEDVELSGVATLHGPVSVDFVAPTAVTLSSVAASPAAGVAALPWLWVVAAAAGAVLGASRMRR